MGCWNGTCAITNVPVTHGEDVVVMLLVQQPREIESLCYPTAFWRPYPFYFYGKYNDYGGVEKCYGDLLPYILEDIKSRLVPVDQGENPYHHIPVNAELLTLDYLFEADHAQRLFIKSPQAWKCEPTDQFAGCENKLRLEHVIIRRRVWDNLMIQYYTESYRNDDKTYLIDIVEAGRAELQQMIEDAKETDIDARLITRFSKMLDYDNPFHWVKESSKFCDTSRPIALVEKLVDHDRIAHAEAAIVQMCSMYWLDAYMNDCRRMWTPMSGAGSQNDSTRAQELTANLTLAAVNEHRTRWSDDPEDGDSE